MITKLLIANRGAIAVRIIRACRALGISSVAVFSDADRAWLASSLADEAVRIGTDTVAMSYLNADRIIAAAHKTGADAIHPGYGFFAESAAFARLCRAHDLTFVGPEPDTIELMGHKARAKSLVARLGIPVIPGAPDVDQTDDALLDAADTLRYPVLIKAALGGGGIGMRVVTQRANFHEALRAVKREAKAAFGDDRVLIERYFFSVRHIEVQVLADRYGGAIHCFERECSLQRRRQKVIEEAPSAFVTDSLRRRLCEASLEITRAIHYTGIGTIEFIVPDDPVDQTFYFLEMNTRLQVEHGITEQVTGIDLVKQQIELAEGRPLSVVQGDVHLRGHAIECRLYAEDPLDDFMPAAGVAHWWRPPVGEGVRVETGLASGALISPFYDPMVAKIIALGPDRARALRTLQRALGQCVLLGPQTNQQLLLRILDDDGFRRGEVHNGYIEQHQQRLTAALPEEQRGELCAIAAIALALQETRRLAPGQGGPYQRQYTLYLQNIAHVVHLVHAGAERFVIHVNGRECRLLLQRHGRDGGELTVLVDDLVQTYHALVCRGDAVDTDGKVHVHRPGLGSFVVTQPARRYAAATDRDESRYAAPMPAVVAAVLVIPGQTVKAGERLIVLESMKMESSVCAKSSGIVAEVMVAPGSAVEAGRTLLTISPEDGQVIPLGSRAGRSQ